MDWGGIPRPVSRTVNSTRRGPLCRATTSTKPSAVNLRALVVRLSSTRLNATGWPIRKSASGAVSRTVRLFSSAMGCTMSRTDSRMSVTENGIGIEVDQPVAAPGQLDHVARHRAEPERGAVDQAELALLDRVHRAAASALEGLGQEEDRGERRAQIVGDLHHQLQAVGSGEPIGEVLRPVRLQPLAHLLQGREHQEQLPRLGNRRQPLDLLEEGPSHQAQQPPGERRAGHLHAVGG